MGWIKENLKTVIIVVVIGGIVAFYGGIKVADMPFFCGMLCHEMQPHVDSLKASKHGQNGVVCMDCHSHPGFFNHAIEHIVSVSFVVPSIKKIYYEDEQNSHKNVQGFNKEEMDFQHKTPAERDKLAKECLKCHSVRLVGSYFMAVPEPKKEMMNENCHHCHEEIVESGEEDLERAKTLLTAETEKPAFIANVHPLHIGKDIYCAKCHNRVVHNNDPSILRIGMDNCMRCHNGEIAPTVECQGCHNGPKNVFAGTGAKDVTGSAGLMAEEDCTGCHNEDEAFKFSNEQCISCHDDAEYANTRKEWQATYTDSLTKTTVAYNAIEISFEKAQAEERTTPELEETYKKIEYNYAFVVNDRSKGVHNNEFTDSIFEDINTKIAEIKEAIK